MHGVPSPDAIGHTERKAFLSAIIYASVVAEFSLLVMPFIVGAMIDSYGLTVSQAGRLVSVELAGMAISSILASSLIRHINRYTLACTIIAMIGAANIGAAVGSSVILLGVLRFIAGFGEGALMATMGSITSGTSRPARVFALVGFAVALAAAAALALTPLVEALGHRGIFWMIGALSLGALGAMPFMRAESSQPPPERQTTAREAVLSPNGLLALLSFACFYAAAAGLWVFAERIGLHHGLSLKQIGFLLSLGQLGGIPGPLIMRWLVDRWRMTPMFVMAMLVHIVAGLGFVFLAAGWAYGLTAGILSLSSMFLVPCFRSLMALLDRAGSLVAASVAFFTVGYGLAPLAITYFLQDSQGFAPIAVMSSTLYVIALILLVRPALSLDRQSVLPTP